jgi:hypothetical protein
MLCALMGLVVDICRPRQHLVVENFALLQQVAAFKARGRPARIRGADKLFWVLLRRFWAPWRSVLVFVESDTVVRWHRAGFRTYWTWRARRKRSGRPNLDAEVRVLIRRMAAENPTWGAPRIHGELVKLGLDVSERTVSRCMPRRPTVGDAAKRWKVLLRNHAGGIAAVENHDR